MAPQAQRSVPARRSAVVPASALIRLIELLRERGHTVIGPTVRDGAIVLAELGSADELPYGWGVTLEAGRYRLRLRTDRLAFGHSAGPQSWKNFLHPPRARLWSLHGDPKGGARPVAEEEPRPRYAFLGVRPCDLRAIAVLDRVLASGEYPDPTYRARRDGNFVVAVECTEPGETCFCASMGTGPGVGADAGPGYDLALTELDGAPGDADGAGEHRFLVRVGTEAGAEVLDALPHRPADEATVSQAHAEVAAAEQVMLRPGRRTMPPAAEVREIFAASVESPQWQDVASRCLTCGNCTMVCPTCFCTTTEDVTDLTGDNAERWRRWDSCFDLDFSYLHGGSVRISGASRYRQWLTHKLGTWHDQFGSSGCVGCGRCIVWCPVGIDITQEVAALRDTPSPEPGDQP
jgi:sulfhydrogenase subunit beta (sulfur reductase)